MFSIRHAVIASLLLAAPALAVTETAIRSEVRTGVYNNTEINARVNATVKAEFTGRRSDVVYIVFRRQSIRIGTLGQYIDSGARTTNLGGGVFRVVGTLQSSAAPLQYSVELRDSGNRLIDSDPVIIR